MLRKFDRTYPVESIAAGVAGALASCGRCVVTAAPGSGKTTVLPLTLLDAPWLSGRKILMLEPRRLAAKMAVWRMSDLLGERAGERVGYRVRLENCVGPRTRLEVVTEGILTRMIQDDASLEGVGLVIFDEFHERSIHADLGLALALDVAGSIRPDLKIMIMSATMDVARVSSLLGDAPVLSCEGRMYPVVTQYVGRPKAGYDEFPKAVAGAVGQALSETGGDVLVFLPGMSEIRAVERKLPSSSVSGLRVMALHSSIPKEEQESAVLPDPGERRKVVLSTSIAETSLTIEGVTAVVDSCLERTAEYRAGTGMDRLVTGPASQSSLEQRRGRAGRVAPGKCYRLIAEFDVRGLPDSARPGMLCSDLAPLALELALWGCAAEPQKLKWLDLPPETMYKHAMDVLREIDAVDGKGRVTSHGRAMSAAGIHPRLAHMILRGRELGQGSTACDLAALLSDADFLRAGSAPADLRTRLEMLSGKRAADPDADRFRLETVKRAAADLKSRFKCGRDSGSADDAGKILILAFPDRVGRRRDNDKGQYLLSNGRGVGFRQADSLMGEEFLVVVDFDDRDGHGRILRAAPVSYNDIRNMLADHVDQYELCRYDPVAGRVSAIREERLGSVILGGGPLPKPDPLEAARLLLEAVKAEGLGRLSWPDQLLRWRGKVNFLHKVPGLEKDYPDFSDKALLEAADKWLPDLLANKTAFSQIKPDEMWNALRNLLGWKAAARLDELVPDSIEVPTGSRIKIDYENEAGPVLAVRLQEVFGWRETPRIADGKVQLTLHLLSPAMRPVQVTRDLASFWREGYFHVRKELRGRYPKHYWPDDPLVAEPTKGVRKKNR